MDDDDDYDGPPIQKFASIKIKKRPKSSSAAAPKKTDKVYWIELQLKDANDDPLMFVNCELIFDDGQTRRVRSNEYGVVRVDGLSKPGNCNLRFPALAKQVGAVDSKEKKSLKITRVDSRFAPGSEKLNFDVQLSGMKKSDVTLEVSSEQYPDGPIYKGKIHLQEKSAGTYSATWDGKLEEKPTSGVLKGRGFINPLCSPYTIKLSHGAVVSESKKFEVLYHSVTLSHGFWVPEEEPDPDTEKEKWVQYRLNELGYYGGPVGTNVDDCLKKAIVRYRHNHKDLYLVDHRSYNTGVSDDLIAALDAEQDPRPSISLNDKVFTDPTKTSPIFVEPITYENLAEFNRGKKSQVEAQRLNRPLVPVDATIMLKSLAGKGVQSPYAVGDVRVNWRIGDPLEDLSPQFVPTADQPSQTKAYLEKCLKLNGGREGDVGDNCPKAYRGIRDTEAKNYKAAALLGDAYDPYEVEDDGAHKVIYTKAYVGNEKKTYPGCLGKAGFFFRPSYISGDSYQITAELDFEGLSNKDALEKAHEYTSEPQSRVHAKTGTFQIRRSAKVVALVRWPGRKGGIKWEKVVAEYKNAHMDLDVSDVKVFDVADLITNEEYVSVIKRHVRPKRGVKVEADAGCVYGMALPKQGSQSSSAYINKLKALTTDNFELKAFLPLARLFSEKLRRLGHFGFVMIDFRMCRPFTVVDWPPHIRNTRSRKKRRALQSQARKAAKAKNAGDGRVVISSNFDAPAFSLGAADSVVFLYKYPAVKYYADISHEIGHCLFIRHWEHAPGSQPAEHDRNDHNCTMSYPSNTCKHEHHHGVRKMTPHFCGKCNLRLRGWKVPALPSKS